MHALRSSSACITGPLPPPPPGRPTPPPTHPPLAPWSGCTAATRGTRREQWNRKGPATAGNSRQAKRRGVSASNLGGCPTPPRTAPAACRLQATIRAHSAVAPACAAALPRLPRHITPAAVAVPSEPHLRGVRVVGAAHHHRLVLQQELLACSVRGAAMKGNASEKRQTSTLPTAREAPCRPPEKHPAGRQSTLPERPPEMERACPAAEPHTRARRQADVESAVPSQYHPLTAGGLPVELDQRLLALGVDQDEGVHPKALHVAVVGRHAPVIQQEGELQGREREGRTGKRRRFLPRRGSRSRSREGWWAHPRLLPCPAFTLPSRPLCFQWKGSCAHNHGGGVGGKRQKCNQTTTTTLCTACPLPGPRGCPPADGVACVRPQRASITACISPCAWTRGGARRSRRCASPPAHGASRGASSTIVNDQTAPLRPPGKPAMQEGSAAQHAVQMRRCTTQHSTAWHHTAQHPTGCFNQSTAQHTAQRPRAAPACLDVALGVGLQGVDHVGELHAVADEEHLQVLEFNG